MATADFKLKGVDKFMKNLNREIKALKGRTLEGLIHAVIELQREAEPMTPLDQGNLRASWFSVSYKGEHKTNVGIVKWEGQDAGKLKAEHQSVKKAAQAAMKSISSDVQPIILFGYTANYAVFVHENVDADFSKHGGKRAQQARARWLYTAMQQAQGQMLEQIRKHARFR